MLNLASTMVTVPLGMATVNVPEITTAISANFMQSLRSRPCLLGMAQCQMKPSLIGPPQAIDRIGRVTT